MAKSRLSTIEKSKNNNIALYNTLYNMIKFLQQFSTKNEYDEMLKNLLVARKIVGENTISHEVSNYILLFEEDIKEENIKKLTNFRYEDLIIDGTEEQTKMLIIDIISSTKTIWATSSQENKNIIKNFFKKLLNYSIKYKRYGELILSGR